MKIFINSLVIVTALILMPINAYPQGKFDYRHENARLELKPDKILCHGQEYDGMRGTLYVPQDRTRPDSITIELPKWNFTPEFTFQQMFQQMQSK